MRKSSGSGGALLRLMRNSRGWIALLMLVVVISLHYPQQILGTDSPSLFSFLGLTRHAVERLLLLVPVTYISFFFGIWGGIASLVLALLIMLPRVFLISSYLPDALFETIVVIIIGGMMNLWFHMHRRNIAQREKVEAALRESEKTSRDLFEGALDAIWVHDLRGNIQAVNKAAAELSGYSLEELSGMNVKSFLSDESLNLARKVRRRLLRHQSISLPYEQNLIKRDGTEAVCMITTNLISGSGGKPKAFQNIARDVTEAKRLYENLDYYLQQITRAQEEERKRIARELHDSTAQTLIALLHQLENFLGSKLKLSVRQAKTLWGFHEQIRDVLQEVRRFSRDLRPSILDDLGLLPALEWLGGELRKEYGIEADLEVTGSERRLPQEAELLLFRIVQEALSNVAKHAHALKVEVKVRFVKKKVTVTVTDDGIGFQPPENIGALPPDGKLGLAGMQERVRLLGGSLKLESEPGKGTTVFVEAPV